MPLVIAFISQKGGVGKSSLARAFATFAIRVGLTATIIDLDVEQRTSSCWEMVRQRRGIMPAVEVQSLPDAASAFASSIGDVLLIFDTPGRITDDTTEIAKYAHLLVQPTSPSADELPLALLVFQALERTGVPRERLAFALTRVLSDGEQLEARTSLTDAGYTVLRGSIPERLEYRQAMRDGCSIAETGQVLKARVDEYLCISSKKPPRIASEEACRALR